MSDPLKTILVTGANRGLGAAIASAFHKEGWRVIGTARRPESLAPAIIDEAHALDLSDPASLQAFSAAITAAGPVIDLMVNNAGFNPKDRKDDPDYFRSTFSIDSFSAANVAESMWINALAPTELVSKLLPLLAEDGVVLNISSWLGSIGGKSSGGHYGYAGSKALLNMMTRAIAGEWSESGRSAVALNPGWMQTDMGGAKADRTPEEVARAVFALWRDGKLSSANGNFLNTDGSTHPW
ncbi:SDR family NAD(P)-dependent oxidoreductase [Cognatiyoonia sp. IB215446]|uniref:SDR family NAD(P)-dependent oxidoreductase n=1 Tax=Cognatiyoonia sp. IB215446 TaxID=3097355 RepID=UPI002A13843C|nr:SDR family NAD(P)-dependent oxidoreductase [Cognatiyoonia sp. IB215446]MDX8346969.1 SDR family NAD(P)-dependent oxidoreductase [Cognatiyoonia sp. IB215446]